MLAVLKNWHKARGKPVMVKEYGADTVAGIHMEPPWSSLKNTKWNS